MLGVDSYAFGAKNEAYHSKMRRSKNDASHKKTHTVPVYAY